MPTTNLLRVALLAGACLLGSGPAQAQTQPQALATYQSMAAADKAALLQGVGPVLLPGEPDALCTTVTLSEQPEIILTAEINPEDLRQSFQLIALASSRLGKGKVLVFSTPAYFRKPLVQEAEVQKLLLNCLRWGSPARRKRVQVWGGDEALTTFLTRQAWVKLVGTDAAPDPSADILLLNREVADTVQISRIERFVRQGGTLLYGCPLPDRQRQQPQRVLADLPLNRLLQKAGLLQTNYLGVRYEHRTFLSAGAVPKYLGIRNILQSLRSNGFYRPLPLFEGGYIQTYTLEKVLALSASDSPVLQQLRQAAQYGGSDSLIVPTPAQPLRVGENRRYAAYFVQHLLRDIQLRNHPSPAYVAPAAATFPGAVPATAARVSTELVVPVRVGGYGLLEPGPGYRRPHSTGLYVPAGEKVVIYLAGRDSARHLAAQVGVHDNDLTHLTQVTREAFDLTRSFDLTRGRTEVYSPYGGLLLLNVPDTTALRQVRIKVVGAVRAPRFELGKTSVAEWQRIRQYPAPWAELASANVSLTVPAARIRTLNDPEKVLAFWDAVLTTDAQLAALPGPRRHPERIVVDQDVAYGYMFATPQKIVVPNDAGCPQMLDADFMWKNGSWGHFHELGHRHQFWGLDFEGLGEVSVNLYTMYVFDKLLHKGLYNHPQIPSRAAVATKVTAYLAGVPSFEKWQQDPFLALCMYVQLIDAFGWAPIEQVYRQYRQLPRSQYPATEAAKRDYWFAAISAATRRNLAPFFAQWQVPVSAAAAQSGAAYPTWLPPEMQKK